MEEFIEYFLSFIKIEKAAASSTIHKYRADLNRLKNYLISKLYITDFSNVELGHVRSYLAYLASSFEYQSSSMANKIIIIRHFFNFLAKSKYIDNNPVEMIKTPQKSKKLPRALNEIELKKLLKAPESLPNNRNKIRDKLILTLFAYTGIRRGELLNLDWDDVNLGENWMAIRKSKNKESRVFPCTQELLSFLKLTLPSGCH